MIDRHIMIMTYYRTGATWLMKLFDTSPHVKTLFEPDEHAKFIKWPFDNKEELNKRILGYEDVIKPNWTKNKRNIDTAVYKLDYVFNGRWDYSVLNNRGFEQNRKQLEAQVIHLVRNPIRWIASVCRYIDQDIYMNDLIMFVRKYVERNQLFYNLYSKEKWYRLVHHDNLVKNTKKEIETLFHWVGIQATPKLHEFIKECHRKDTIKTVHDHNVIQTKNSVLNRWKDVLQKPLIDESRQLIKKSFLFKDI